MKILWLVNLALPEASELMGHKVLPFGGWLVNTSKAISACEGIELHIAFPSPKRCETECLLGSKIHYYPFSPITKYKSKLISQNEKFDFLLKKIQPDLVHIFGTEMPHSLSMVNMCLKNGIEAIVSIQGLVSVYASHIFANLPYNVINGSTFRNLIKGDNILKQERAFRNNGINEVEAIKNTRHIIGRTTWDHAVCSQINSDANYHFCNETLREEFYAHKWDIDNCERHSIFLSQGNYPVKGLHYAIEALRIVSKCYPQAKLYVGGFDITRMNSIRDRLLLTYYGRYIKKLLKKYDLERSVVFTGLLDEKSMCARYLKSHTFICSSSIENSPNSLGEAMILGVPTVASYVGGIPDMLIDGSEGFLYQADAPYMLAHYICEIFKDDELALRLSQNARSHALCTHDRMKNTTRLLDIYRQIITSTA